MSYNMMIGYDIYDRITIEHFPLRPSMILTTSFFCSRQYFLYVEFSDFYVNQSFAGQTIPDHHSSN
jgi:hypothetical protein